MKEALPLFKGGASLNTAVLLAESEDNLQWCVEKLHEAMKRHRLKVNWSKSNTMVFSRVPTESNIEIDGERMKNVKETMYLGVKLSEDGKMGSEVERRIGMTKHYIIILFYIILPPPPITTTTTTTTTTTAPVTMHAFSICTTALRERPPPLPSHSASYNITANHHYYHRHAPP